MTPYPLSRSDTTTKVLITLFLLTTLAAFTVAELNVYDKVGRIKNGVVQRYGPEEVDGAATSNSGQSADTSSLPLEAEPSVARMNTFTALLDITHPHVFEIPLVLFVLAHFLMRTRAANWFKLANYLLAFIGVTAFLAAPWAVRYLSPRMAPLLYTGAIAVGLSSFIMIAVTVWDIWRPLTKNSARTVRQVAKGGNFAEPAGGA
jgi:hypothetical protein